MENHTRRRTKPQPYCLRQILFDRPLSFLVEQTRRTALQFEEGGRHQIFAGNHDSNTELQTSLHQQICTLTRHKDNSPL